MKLIATRPKSLTDKPTHYCPGCTHGIVHRIIGEIIDELDLREETIGVCPVGCAVLAYEYFNLDMQEAAHGRAPAVATAIKRVHPEATVFTYQGDGDLASIGIAEIVHAAMRGEKFTTIFINNAIYGMTGGQMAPTTMIGQKTTTSPYGRDAGHAGYPIKISEMLATLQGAVYIARCALFNNREIKKTKRAIKKAFEIQKAGLGFALVEVLSTCPTNWGMDPYEALKWVESDMVPYYPLGELKTPEGVND